MIMRGDDTGGVGGLLTPVKLNAKSTINVLFCPGYIDRYRHMDVVRGSLYPDNRRNVTAQSTSSFAASCVSYCVEKCTVFTCDISRKTAQDKKCMVVGKGACTGKW
jgi:hypothetical protein